MATAAVFGQGTLLKIGDGGGSEVFTTVAEVGSITGPGMKVAMIPATSHDSANHALEVVAGMIDPGQVSFDLNYIPTAATHNVTTGILRDMKNRTKRNWQLIFPDGSTTTWAFAAYVEEFTTSEPVDNILKAAIKLHITGLPTLV